MPGRRPRPTDADRAAPHRRLGESASVRAFAPARSLARMPWSAEPPTTASAGGRSVSSTWTGLRASQDRTAASSSARSRGHGKRDRILVVGSKQRAASEPDAIPPGVAQHDGARAHEPAVGSRTSQALREGAQPVSRERGLLVALLRRQEPHSTLERFEEPVRVRKGGDQLPDELSVALERRAAVARRNAAAHVGERARREARGGPHDPGTPADRIGIFERLLRERRLPGIRKRAEEGGLAARLPNDLQPREGLSGIDLQVRVSAPGLAPPVVPGLVITDEPCLEDQRLELRGAPHAVDDGGLREEVLDLLPGVPVEVALHPGAQVGGLAHVQHAAVPGLEQVHARCVGKRVRQTDLREVRAPPRADRLMEVAEGQDAEAAAELEQAVQDLGARLRVVQGSMARPHRRAEILGERVEADVRDLRPDDAPRESRGAHRGRGEGLILEPGQRGVHEGEVEPGVVGDEDPAPQVLDELGEDRFDRRHSRDGHVVDAGEVGDRGRDRAAGIDQRVEDADPLAAAIGDRPHLRDRGLGGGASGGLEVDDAERHVVQRHALVERALKAIRVPHRRSLAGPRGAPRYRTRVRESRRDRGRAQGIAGRRVAGA